MDWIKEKNARNDLKRILFDLSESQDMLCDASVRAQIYVRLEKLYCVGQGDEGFYLFQSDVFSVLYTVAQGDQPGSIDILGQNLEQIRKGYQAKNTDSAGNRIDISREIRELCDSVSLHMAQMGYSDAADQNLSQEENLREIQGQVNAMKSNLDSVQKEIEKQKKTADGLRSMQKEYIAILGIFAAVVLAFTGGIAFSTSVLQNIHKVSVYRIALIALVIGFVLVNIIYGLFYYIDRLVYKTEKRGIKPLWLTNVILILLMLVLVVGWYFGAAEKRNLRVRGEIAAMDSGGQSVSSPLNE